MHAAMRSLVRGIVTSHETRTADLSSLRQRASAQREQARRGLHEVAESELRRKAEVRRWLTDAASSRTRRAAQVRASLAGSRAALARAAAGLRGEARASLSDLASGRNEMATLLRQDLEKADARRRSDTLDFMARITDDRRAATAQVRASLSDLASGRSEMATLLRQDLARGLAALGKADARRRSDTLDFMARITDDRRAAGREWRELAVALRESRTGVAILEPPAVRPAPEEAPEEQRAPAEAEVARTREARTPLRDRVFAHLADHPDGVRLIEIEREFGLGRLQASRLVGSLIEEGKAAKRDRFYFAT